MEAAASELQVDVVASDLEWEHAKAIRQRVFIEEQACPPEEEWDEYEGTSRHLVGHVGGLPVAVARWRAVPHAGRVVAKLERFAVLKEYRGRGYGQRMVEAAMADARRAGFEEYLLYAQEHLTSFYGAFGFSVCGDRFIEANIPHLPMQRLSDEPPRSP